MKKIHSISVRIATISILIIVIFAAKPVLSDDNDILLGNWKLISWERETIATGQKKNFWGTNPSGYMIFTREGRTMVIITGEGRLGLNTNQHCQELISTMSSYTGTYKVQGDKWITKVDVASNPGLVGNNQIRTFKIEGNRLQVISGDGRTMKDILIWEKSTD
jgi:hypothetical protein